MSGEFNPHYGTFGDYPAQTGKPTIQLGAWGNHVRYLEGSLYWCSEQYQLYVDLNSQPCLFNNADRAAVLSFQHQWQIVEDGIVGPQTWGCIDYNNALHGRY